MTFRHVGVVLWLGLCVSVGAADVADKPAVRNEKGERVWALNSYLKGTSDDIKQSLSGEVRRFKGLIAETSAAIEDERRTIDAHKADVLAQYRSRPDYAKADADAKVHEQKLNDARAARDGRASMEQSRLFNNARESMAKIDRDADRAAMASPPMKGAAQRLADQEAKLAGLQKGLADAIKWRDQVAGATRNSFTLDWPLSTGRIGTLGEVTPRSVDADGNLVCSCRVAEEIAAKGKATEGIASLRVLLHPTMVTIRGSALDLKRVKFDRPMRFDESVSVVSVRPTYEGDIEAHVVVQVRKDDLGELMAAITAALAE